MRKSLVELMAEGDPADSASPLTSYLEDIMRVAHAAARSAAHETPERPEPFNAGMETLLELAVCMSERIADGVATLTREAGRGGWCQKPSGGEERQ